MSDKNSPAIEQIITILNNSPTAIYVSAIDNYELLYINEAGRKTFGITELSGQKCYTALQGKDAPCDFCTTSFLKSGENYTWETTNPLTKRHYLLKDRLIQWEGRSARLEIAFDITETEAEKQSLKTALDAESMIMYALCTGNRISENPFQLC